MSDILADVAVFMLGILLLIYGIRFCTSPLGMLGRYASMPSLSKFWQYLSIPVAGLGMIIFELEQLIIHIKVLLMGENEEGSEK